MRQLLCAAAFLSVLSFPSAQKGPALTNHDVTRLIAIGVSDETVIAVINQATATEFDLSEHALEGLTSLGVSAAVVTAMHRTAAGAKPAVDQPVPIGGAVSLAAVAKAEEARRAKAAKASRVITEKDVGGGTIPVPKTAAPATSTTRSTDASGSAEADPPNGPTKAQLADIEETQRRVMEKLRADLSQAESGRRRDMESYQATCPTPQSSLKCRSLHSSISVEWPAKIKRLQDELARVTAAAR